MEEVKKEKSRADAVEQTVEILQQSLKLAKKSAAAAKVVLEGLHTDKINLQTENDTLKVEVKMLKDLRVEDEAKVAKQIDDSNEVAINNALYQKLPPKLSEARTKMQAIKV